MVLVSARPQQAALQRLVELATGGPADAVWSHLQAQREQGDSIDCIFRELIAPAVRRIGERWQSDECNQAELALGLGTLQLMVRRFSAHRSPCPPIGSSRSVAIAVRPDEPHSVLAQLLSHRFAQAGWDASGVLRMDHESLMQHLREREVDVLVLCESGALPRTDRLTEMGRWVRAARSAARTELLVLASGRTFVDLPDAGEVVGADASVIAPHDAVRIAEARLRTRATQSMLSTARASIHAVAREVLLSVAERKKRPRLRLVRD